MVDKTAFTPDEWNTVLASPMLAGMAVTLGEPSGLWGTMKEGMASATARQVNRMIPPKLTLPLNR